MKKGAKRSGFKEDHYTFYEGGKFEMRKKRIVSLCITMSLIIGSLHIWMIRAEANQSRYQYFASGYSYNSDPATYMVNIAKAQIGRTQSEFGYTEGWCDNFISDCAIIAKQEAAVPQGGAVSDFLNRLLSAGATKVSSPKAGDIVIFSSSAGYTHAGLMTDSTNCINGNFWSYGYSQVESPTSYSGINSYNGWTSLTIMDSADFYSIGYIRINAENEFFLLNEVDEPGYDETFTLFRYNPQTKQLDFVQDLRRIGAGRFAYQFENVELSGTYLKITALTQVSAIGGVYFDVDYVFEGDRFVTEYKETEYISENERKDFTCDFDLDFYQSPGSFTKSFSASRGSTVTIEKVFLTLHTHTVISPRAIMRDGCALTVHSLIMRL